MREGVAEAPRGGGEGSWNRGLIVGAVAMTNQGVLGV